MLAFIVSTENNFFSILIRFLDVETYDRLIYIVRILKIVSIIYPLGCHNGTYGFNCKETCTKCQNTSCERVDVNCTDGCIKDYEGHQCQLAG